MEVKDFSVTGAQMKTDALDKEVIAKGQGSSEDYVLYDDEPYDLSGREWTSFMANAVICFVFFLLGLLIGFTTRR